VTLRPVNPRSSTSRLRSLRTTAWRIAWAMLLGACLITAAEAQGNSSQGAKIAADPHPLRPPETSSPRQTLQTFLSRTDRAVEAWRQGALDSRGVRNVLDAVETLDYSAIANADSLLSRIERVLLLKELLDRLPLPPPGVIPGEREVAAEGIT